MAPMRKPAPPSDDPWRNTLSIDAYARKHQLTPREVRHLLGTGQVPFVQLRGQIRIPPEAIDETALPLDNHSVGCN